MTGLPVSKSSYFYTLNNLKNMHIGRNTLLLVSTLFISLVINAQKVAKDGLPVPKNVIIMIGDGMGFNHIKATNYYDGVTSRDYEKFPVRLALATYPAKAGEYESGKPAANFYATGYNTVAAWSDTSYLKKNYTESAAAGTALATGKKTYNNSIGISVNGDTLVNLVQQAKMLGKSAGVVTTVPFSHATPAGFVAHNATRVNYSQIAYEMILKCRCDVIMGCGNPMYDNDGKQVRGSWKNSKYVGDSAFWVSFLNGSGLQTTFTTSQGSLTVCDIDGDGKADPWHVIRDKNEFRKLASGFAPKRVFGCPNVYSTLQNGRTALNGENNESAPCVNPLIPGVPTLAEMVMGALNVLDNNRKGFFLMVEGGAIDWASHSNQKGRVIEEMRDFNDAIAAVISWVDKSGSWDETMVIVTADHETGLLWGRNPYEPLEDRGEGNLPGMSFFSGDHTNSLVPFYAMGKGSELYHLMADEIDSVRGPYLQNAEMAALIKLLWHIPEGQGRSNNKGW